MRGYENKLWAVHRKDLHKTQQTHWASQPQETLWGAAVSRQGSQYEHMVDRYEAMVKGYEHMAKGVWQHGKRT